MTLCTYDLQTACCTGFIIDLDIGTTASHVGGDRYMTMDSGLSYDLSLFFMVLRIQYFMRNTLSVEQLRYML